MLKPWDKFASLLYMYNVYSHHADRDKKTKKDISNGCSVFTIIIFYHPNCLFTPYFTKDSDLYKKN